MTRVMTTAVTTKYAQLPQLPTPAPVGLRLIPAVEIPNSTTLLHSKPITKPNAAPNDVAIVLRISPAEILRSSAMRLTQPPDRVLRSKSYRSAAFVSFSFVTTRMPSIRAPGYCPFESFSRAFTMSHIVNRATATP